VSGGILLFILGWAAYYETAKGEGMVKERVQESRWGGGLSGEINFFPGPIIRLAFADSSPTFY
jgi:hypothetical protein